MLAKLVIILKYEKRFINVRVMWPNYLLHFLLRITFYCSKVFVLTVSPNPNAYGYIICF